MEAVRRNFKTWIAGVSVHVHYGCWRILATLAFLGNVHTACRKITDLDLVKERDLNSIPDTRTKSWSRTRDAHFRGPNLGGVIYVVASEVTHRSLARSAGSRGIGPVLFAEYLDYGLECRS